MSAGGFYLAGLALLVIGAILLPADYDFTDMSKEGQMIWSAIAACAGIVLACTARILDRLDELERKIDGEKNDDDPEEDDVNDERVGPGGPRIA